MSREKHPKEHEIIELANLLVKLDNAEHTIPYEAWAAQIIDEGYTKLEFKKVHSPFEGSGAYAVNKDGFMELLTKSAQPLPEQAEGETSGQPTSDDCNGSHTR
jgi:hypothetical protein